MTRPFLAVLLVVLAGMNPLWAGQRVEVRFDIADGLGDYTGLQPVTFGVPFVEGTLKKTDGLRLVDQAGNPLPGQFEVTGTWGPDSPDVRWLLIDAMADVRAGQAQQVFLEYGPDVKPPAAGSALKLQPEGKQVRVDTGAGQFTISGKDLGTLGQFALTDGTGKRYVPGGKDGNVELVVEKNGPVRGVVKLSGKYLADDGSSIADFVTRVRFYAGQPFARIYHTMIWTVDENVEIGALRYTLPTSGASSIGLDGTAVAAAPTGQPLFQTDWNVVAGGATGKQLDGWIGADAGKGPFVALRWAWQQFPVSFAATDSTLEVGLIGPQEKLSLRAMDVAVEAVKKTGNKLANGGLDTWDTNANVPIPGGEKDHKEGWISPRGVAKTYEMLVWFGNEQASPSPQVKNLLAQHPVFAYADPAFAVRAGVPSPASAYDPERFPVVEAALQRAFGWVTRLNAIDGDYGLWNFGDIQWSWVEQGGYTVYRYWMNHGKGWSAVPWALWLRSGDRAYYEHAEANSRHCMDIDLCHVDDWSKVEPGKPRDGKIKGGVYHYCAVHWAYGPRVLPFYSDCEYLPVYYHMTGYERAKDVMMERIDTIKNDPQHFDYMWKHFQDYQKHARHLYAPTKDLLALYEATWDPTIGKYARDLIDLMLRGQEPNGHFFGVKTNHYLDQTLHMARRVLGDEDGRIADAITRWTVFNGDTQVGGPALDIDNGWMSLWSLLVTGEKTNDPHYLQMAERIMTSQAAVVDDSQTEWRGICPIFIHEIGPALRDWPIVMAAVSKAHPEKPATTEYEPMTYICGMWEPSPTDKAAGWKHREIAMLLSETGEAVQAKIHLWGGGIGDMPYRMRIHAPDGSVLREEDQNVTFAGQYGAKDQQTMGAPVAVDIPAGRAGVYAVEFMMQARRPMMHVISSNGKVVYAFKPKAGNFLISPVYAGQAWFEPLGGEPLTIGFPANQVMGRMTLFGPDGNVVATSQSTGTREVKAADHGQRPAGDPIRVEADAIKPGLHAFLSPTPRDKNCTHYISGTKPWFAARKTAYFDPMKFPHPDLDAIMKEK